MIKKQIEDYLISHIGYLKKSPINVAQALWKASPKHTQPKTTKELQKELDQIREVQSDLRKAKTIGSEQEETKLLDIYQKIIDYKNQPKRVLFYDIETSFNIVYSWSIGRKISISDENILEERKIICISYKWAHETNVHSLVWKSGDDKELLEKFSKIVESADECIGHNSDQFDSKHIRARCLFHRIAFPVKLNGIDTLKMARQAFKLNSNKLNYIAQFLGLGKKLETGGIQLWKDVILNQDKVALAKMVNYCNMDVILLEKVYNQLQSYCPIKRFKYKI